MENRAIALLNLCISGGTFALLYIDHCRTNAERLKKEGQEPIVSRMCAFAFTMGTADCVLSRIGAKFRKGEIKDVKEKLASYALFMMALRFKVFYYKHLNEKIHELQNEGKTTLALEVFKAANEAEAVSREAAEKASRH